MVKCPSCNSTKIGTNHIVIETRDIKTRKILDSCDAYIGASYDDPKYTCECGHNFGDSDL